MARIRRLQISNFRSIQALDWVPAPGINCLIGPGDSGKSSILDAIDLCVGARRGGTFGDMDFFALNVDVPITISVALGDLPLSLMDIDVYGEEGATSQGIPVSGQSHHDLQHGTPRA